MQIIDDGDPEFSVVGGGWITESPSPNNFQGDRHFSNSSDAPSTAVYAFDTNPGTYDLASTFWGASSAQTPIRVIDFATGSVLLERRLDQSASPNVVPGENTGWRTVGQFEATGSVTHVEISNVGANGWVVADAMKLTRVLPLGISDSSTGRSLDVLSGISLGSAVVGGSQSRPVTITNTASAPITVNAVSASGLFSVETSLLPGTELLPGQSFSVEIESVGAIGPQHGNITIDGIRGTTSESLVVPLFTTRLQLGDRDQIVDNGDDSFRLNGGGWSYTPNDPQHFQGDRHSIDSSHANGEAHWYFDVEPGVYEVASAFYGGSSVVPMRVFDVETGTLLLDTVLDQTNPTPPLQGETHGWKVFGEFQSTGRRVRVVTTNVGASGLVVADGVRIRQLGSILTGDFDGDGVTTNIAYTADGSLYNVFPDGSWSLIASQIFATNQRIIAADVNFDGRTDLVSVTADQSQGGSWVVGLAQPVGSPTPFLLQYDWNSYFSATLSVNVASADDLQAPVLRAAEAFRKVLEEVQFTPSKKVWKHAEQTLDSASGNAWDQSLALQSLLSDGNIESKIAIGRVSVTGSNFSWLGVDNANAAINTLSLAGLAPVYTAATSTIVFDHARLMARLPGPTGLIWQSLDPSISTGVQLGEKPPTLTPVGVDQEPWLSRVASRSRQISLNFASLGYPAAGLGHVPPTESALRYQQYLALGENSAFDQGKLIHVASPGGENAIVNVNHSNSTNGTLVARVALPNPGDIVRLWAHRGSQFPVAIMMERLSNGQIRYRFENEAYSTGLKTTTQVLPHEFDLEFSASPLGLLAKTAANQILIQTWNSLDHTFSRLPRPGVSAAPTTGVARFASANGVKYTDVQHMQGTWGLEVKNGTIQFGPGGTFSLAGVRSLDLQYFEPDNRSPAENYVDKIVDLAASQTSAAYVAGQAVLGSASPGLWDHSSHVHTSTDTFIASLGSVGLGFTSSLLFDSLPNDQYSQSKVNFYVAPRTGGSAGALTGLTINPPGGLGGGTGFMLEGLSYVFGASGSDPTYTYSPLAQYVFRTADLAHNPASFRFANTADIPNDPNTTPGLARLVLESGVPISVSAGANATTSVSNIVGISIYPAEHSGPEISHKFGVRTTMNVGQMASVGAIAGQASAENLREQWANVMQQNRDVYLLPPTTLDPAEEHSYIAALLATATTDLAFQIRQRTEQVSAASGMRAVYKHPEFVAMIADDNTRTIDASEPSSPGTGIVPALPIFRLPEHYSVTAFATGFSAASLSGAAINHSSGAAFDAGRIMASEYAFLQEELVSRIGTGLAIGPYSLISELADSGTILMSPHPNSATQHRIWDQVNDKWVAPPSGHPFGSSWQYTVESDAIRNSMVTQGYRVMTPINTLSLGSAPLIGRDRVATMLAYKPEATRVSFNTFVTANGRVLGGAVQPRIPAGENQDGYDFDGTLSHIGSRIAGGVANLSSGESTPQHTDISLPNVGPSIDFTRRHVLGSQPDTGFAVDKLVDSGLGHGWTHSYADLLVQLPSDASQGSGLLWKTSTGTTHFFSANTGASNVPFMVPAELRGWFFTSEDTNQDLVVDRYTLHSDSGDTWTFERDINTPLYFTPVENFALDQRKVVYHLVEKGDRFGNRVYIQRDLLDQRILSIASAPAGNSPETRLTFTWQSETISSRSVQYVTAITDDLGRRWQYDYQTVQFDNKATKTLVAVTEPTLVVGDTTKQVQYSYSHTIATNGTPTTVASEGLRVVSISELEVERLSDPPGPAPSHAFALTGKPPVTTHYDFYGDGRLFGSRNPAGAETTLLINPWMNRRFVIDELGGLNRYVTNVIGQTVREENARGDTVRSDWNPSAQTRDAVVDASGGITKFEYDSRGRTVAVVLPTGLRHELDYHPVWPEIKEYRRGKHINASGDLVIGSVQNIKTTWVIDTVTGLPSSTTDPLGRTTEFDYDNRGQLRFITTPRGVSTPAVDDFRTEYVYDDRGLLTHVYEPDPDNGGPLTSPNWQFQYRADGGLIQSIDPMNAPTNYTLDVLGRVAQVIQVDPDGAGPLPALITTFSYDYRGNLVERRDPRQVGNFYQYDHHNRLIASLDAAGVGLQWSFDAANNITSTFDGAGTWLTQYDVAGLPKASVDPLGRTTWFRSDGNGNTRITVDPRGAIDQIKYDLGQRPLASVDPRNRSTGYTYDSHDRLNQIINIGDSGATHPELFVYDAADQLVGHVSPVIRNGPGLLAYGPLIPATVYSYDADGNLSQIAEVGTTGHGAFPAAANLESYVAGLPASSKRLTIYTNDSLGRALVVTYNDGATEQFQYDPLGRVIGSINSRGAATDYSYDLVGRLQQVTLPDPDGAGPLAAPTWNHTWDASGNLIRISDPNNNQTLRHYDAHNRLTGIVDAGGGFSQFGYDSAGQHVSTVDQRGFFSAWHFDPAGQLIQSISADPDGVGPLASMTMSYSYDASGNLASVTDHLGRVDDYEYDLIGRVTRWEQPAPSEGQSRPVHQFQYGVAPFTAYNTGFFNNTTYVDPTGRKSVSYDDALGRVRQQSAIGSGGYENFLYNPFNELEEIQAFGSTTIQYDPLPHQVPANSLQEVTRFVRDGVGRLTQRSIARLDLSGQAYPGTPQHVFNYAYDIAGNLTSDFDHTGAETRIAYDLLDRPTSVTAGFGSAVAATTQYRYDFGGRLVETTDPEGVLTAYGYDSLDRLTSQIDDFGGSLQRSSSWAFDPRGNLVSMTDAAGTQTQFAYDGLNRPVSIIEDVYGLNQRTHQFGYDLAGNRASYTNGRGDVLAWTFDRLNRPVSETVGTGTIDALTWQTGYDAAGRVTTNTTPEGVVTRTAYDTFGRLAKITNDDGGPLQWITQFGYDSRGWRSGMIVPQGPANQSETTATRDSLGRELTRVQARGTVDEITTSSVYNDPARTHTALDGLQNPTVYSYDALGRLTQRLSPDPDGGGAQFSARVDYTYNHRGNLLSMTERLTPTLDATTHFTVDALGRTTSSSDPLGRVTQMQYDSRDLLTQVTDPGNTTLSYIYDSLARMTAFDDGAGRVLTYGYDLADNLITVNSPLSLFQYQFDALGRMTAETRISQNLLDEQFVHQYDPNSGRLQSVTLSSIDGTTSTPVSQESFIYDRLGRIVDQRTQAFDNPTLPIVKQTFMFDAVGNLTHRVQAAVDPDTETSTLERTITHDIDFLGRRVGTTEKNAANAIVFDADFTYDDRNQVTQIIRRNATGTATLSSQYQYDHAGQLTNLHHFRPADNFTLAQYAYVLDTSGRITQIDSAQDGIIGYSYDDSGQLLSETRGGVPIANYSWDLAGNRIEPSTVIGPGNRLLADDQYLYSYDSEGRRIGRTDRATDEQTTYRYDAAGRLISAQARSAGDVLLWSTATGYDAVGRRSNEESTTYDSVGNVQAVDQVWLNYEGWNTTSQRNDDGSLRASYVHGPLVDQVLADLRYATGGASQPALMALGDHQGSIRDFAAVDAGNSAMVNVGHRDYDAFGNLRDEEYATGSSSPSVAAAALVASGHLFAYTGREATAEAGRYDYRMRSFDSQSGRFMQPDPLGLRAGDTNLYRYVGNSAVNYIDPLGLTPCTCEQSPAANPAERYEPGQVDPCAVESSAQPAQAAAAAALQSGDIAVAPSINPSGVPLIPASWRQINQTMAPTSSVSGEGNLYQYVGNNPISGRDPSGMEEWEWYDYIPYRVPLNFAENVYAMLDPGPLEDGPVYDENNQYLPPIRGGFSPGSQKAIIEDLATARSLYEQGLIEDLDGVEQDISAFSRARVYVASEPDGRYYFNRQRQHAIGRDTVRTVITFGLTAPVQALALPSMGAKFGKIMCLADLPDVTPNRIRLPDVIVPNSAVTRTNGQLVQDIAVRADNWGTRQGLPALGSRAGTLKHAYADRVLRRYQLMYGDRGLSTEVRYINGQPWRAGVDPVLGSIRLDVVEGPLTNPTTVFDYKFGNATLTPARINQIRQGAGLGGNVPILPVSP